MSSSKKTEFTALDINGKNYMSWTVDVQMHLESMGILDTLLENNDCTSEKKAKAGVFLRKHIDELLKLEYLNIRDPCVLWHILKRRFDIQKEVLLPDARDEWRNLRFQDFKKVNEYSSALFRICSTLEFCGQSITEEDMLEKTYSTFHSSNMNLQQQYRLMNFKRYSDLNSFLLVAEKNNELLMKNSQSRPVGTLALPEANATNKDSPKNNIRGRGRGRGYFDRNHRYGNNHNYGRNSNFGKDHYRGRGRGRGRGHITNYYNGPRDKRFQPQRKNNGAGSSTSQNPKDICYKCGFTGHWSNKCRTPEHLCELYKASLKGKDKEVNLVDGLEFLNTELSTDDYCNDIDI